MSLLRDALDALNAVHANKAALADPDTLIHQAEATFRSALVEAIEALSPQAQQVVQETAAVVEQAAPVVEQVAEVASEAAQPAAEAAPTIQPTTQG